MPTKRMRVFAGPNGSGKTTIVKSLQDKFNFGVYVNADDIERLLNENQSLKFSDYKLKITQKDTRHFFKQSQFSPLKRKELDLWQKVKVTKNVLYVNCSIDSYLAADIAEFIRQKLLSNGISFSYETVMSHENKIQFMQRAQNEGFRVYLYFVATNDPKININRVQIRVAQHGHAVSPKVVENRYFKSLNQLKQAVKNSDRAYLFDNSRKAAVLIAEITSGKDVKVIDTDNVPNWVVEHLFEKS